MLNQYFITAIIPARIGSKRLPKKNIKNLHGKPLIAWSIEAARQSQYVDNIIVSTDNSEIQKISEKYKAKAPFIRPAKLATDVSTSFDVVAHAIKTLNLDSENNIIIILQPTSPMRTSEEIDQALEFFFNKNADGVVSVSKTEHSPLWCNKLPSDYSLGEFIRPEISNARGQDLPTFYRINGSIYIYKSLKLLNKGHIFYDHTVYGFITSENTSIDIDTELDFRFAEFLMGSK